ncbi:MAG: hypothetical protein ABI183_15920 [Polyangiaceae bacterium]
MSPQRYAYSETTNRDDAAWITARVAVHGGAFRGEYEAMLRAEDFPRFRGELQKLHESLGGTARFETMEEWLAIQIEGDGKGNFEASCVALDSPGMGNRLTFNVSFDQTELAAIIRALDAICAAFPVR